MRIVDERGVRMNGNSNGKKESLMTDDDTEKEGWAVKPDLCFRDLDMQEAMLATFNQMRKDKHFCDVTLKLGPFEFPAHRLVLASSSPYLMELFTSTEERPPTTREVENGTGIVYSLSETNVDREALEALVDYAYTSRLEVSASLVERVYSASLLLRMDRASEACARHLRSHITLDSCLSIRSVAGLGQDVHESLRREVDAFIVKNFDELQHLRQLLQLPRIAVEIVHLSNAEKELVRVDALAALVLDALGLRSGEDLEKESNEFMLYLGNDHTLKDCNDIEDGSLRDSDRVKDYKQRNRKRSKSRKVTPSSSRPARSREQLYSRLIEQELPLTASSSCSSTLATTEMGWSVIATQTTKEETQRIVSLVVLPDCTLATLSIAQRVDTRSESGSEGPGSEAFDLDVESVHETSRLTSEERETFASLTPMREPKCAAGACAFENDVIVAGGFNRGECLDNVASFSILKNTWHQLPCMLSKRGRFDTTVVDDTLYAVAGSNGHHDEASAEKLLLSDPQQWQSIAPLPLPVSGIGLTNLDGIVYCVGGTFGQSGNRHCYTLDTADAISKWGSVAPLNQGRAQAGVTAFKDRIWAVGGSDGWNPLASVEVYDPKTDRWNLGPPITCPRRGCAIVAFDDLLYLVGGSDGTQSLCTTEVLDPRLNLWTPGPTMTTCRANVSVAKVGDAIWAVGGFSGKTFLNTLEYLRPSVREEWTAFLPSDIMKDNYNNYHHHDDDNEDNDQVHGEDDDELIVGGDAKTFHVRRTQQLMPSNDILNLEP